MSSYRTEKPRNPENWKTNRQKYAKNWLAGFKKALKGFSVEAPKPHSGSFSGRFGSDSGGLPGCNSDFWSVVNSVHTRCIVKTSGFTRGVCKNSGFY